MSFINDCIRFKELVGLELAKALTLPFAVDAVEHSRDETIFSVEKPPMRNLLGVVAASAAAACSRYCCCQSLSLV